MKGRSLALLFLVYLSLDVANPFMPGAVTFFEGSLEVVDAGRPARSDLPMPCPAAHPGAPSDERVLSPRSAGVAEAAPRRRRWMPVRRSVVPASDAAPTSDDH
jgi:hypothetical protein